MPTPKEVTAKPDTQHDKVDEAKGAVVKPAQASTPSPPAASPRRGPGTKDVPPFQWKLIGDCTGFSMTLFKSVEREEVEAQLERVRKENYYGNLRILDVNEKVRQSAAAKAAVRAAQREKKQRNSPLMPAAKPATAKPATTKPATTKPAATKQAAATAPKPKSVKKATAARPSRASGKKTTAAKKTVKAKAKPKTKSKTKKPAKKTTRAKATKKRTVTKRTARKKK